MRVDIYPKLVAETAGPLEWKPITARAAMRLFNALIRARPGWSIVGFHWHDDDGCFDMDGPA